RMKKWPVLVWVDVVLHKIFPIIVVLDWILDPPRRRLVNRDVVNLLVYPLIWVVLTMIRGALDSWYPYPFLDPAKGGYGQVVITIVAVLVGFIAIALAIMALGNWRRDASPERLPA
ncbi:MAG TPA: Pr6Pr family membrane protein, partial [Candidatus Limnocylindrales bacterium]|nr:Pr6Pr family membrane protein [Candidatus Limnocylindrales bacterium]